MNRRTFSRRDFIGTTGAAIATLAGPKWVGAAASFDDVRDAELVVFNARVYTVDTRLPRAQAFAVKGGRFIAVGSDAQIKGLIGKNTRTFDARQMTVVPGFNDSHNHAPGNTLLYEVLVGNPYDVEFVTIDSIVDKLRAKAQKTPPDTWVEGYFFDDTKVKDKRALTIHDLDRVSTDLPVVVHHRGGHTAFYNSRAFELAGITKASTNPPGGTYDRDANGELNGRVTDNAFDVFDRVGKRTAYSSDERMRRDREGLAYISKQFVRFGLTSVCHESGNLLALEQVRTRGELLHRVSYEAEGPELEAMIAGGMTTGLGDEWIKLGATSEHTVDGSFSERTMAMSVPYPNSTSGYKGNVVETQEALNT